MKKSIIVFFLIIFINNSFCAFDEKTIEPFLGPYKLKNNISNNCPKKLMLMAECSLSRLTLRNSEQFDFIFEDFKGINEGEVKLFSKNKNIGSRLVTFKNNNLTSESKEYWEKSKSWLSYYHHLKLEKGLMTYSQHLRWQSMKDKKEEYNCEYVFDKEKNEEIINEIQNKSHKKP